MSEKNKILIFVPTYNELENIRPLFQRLQSLGLKADILFLDDNSPDGTGELMDELADAFSHVTAVHRSGKLGVGSAHQEGIRYAYSQGYETLITMDADFTHSPETIPKLITKAEEDKSDLVVGSRYLQTESLVGWNLIRKFLTNTAHVLTTLLLRLPFDSTGAFRLYNLESIPEECFSKVQSKGYSFFFESMYLLSRRGMKIAEIPVSLPPRTYGSSKMSYKEIFKSVKLLISLWAQNIFQKDS